MILFNSKYFPWSPVQHSTFQLILYPFTTPQWVYILAYKVLEEIQTIAKL